MNTPLALTLVALTTLATLGLGSRAYAQPSMPTQLSRPSTPATHRQAAEELLRLTTTQETIDTMVTSMVDAMMGMPGMAAHRPAFVRFFRRHFTVDEMVRRLAPHYVQALDELTLRQVSWFYRSGAGQRFLSVMPELTARGATVGQAIVNEHQGELQQLIIDAQRRRQ